MSKYLENGVILGTYDLLNSSARIINSKDLPSFELKIKKKQFLKDEKIVSNGSIGIIENHDVDRDIIKVSTVDDFYVGRTIRGSSSNTIAKIKKNTRV